MNIAADNATTITANAAKSSNSNRTMATASKSTAGSNDSPISTKHIPFRKIQDKVNNADCAIIDTANATNSGNSNRTMGDRGDGGKNGIGMNRVQKKVAELNKLRSKKATVAKKSHPIKHALKAGKTASTFSTKRIPLSTIQDSTDSTTVMRRKKTRKTRFFQHAKGFKRETSEISKAKHAKWGSVNFSRYIQGLCRSPSYAVTEGLIHGFDSVKVVSDFIRFGKNPGTIDIYNAG